MMIINLFAELIISAKSKVENPFYTKEDGVIKEVSSNPTKMMILLSRACWSQEPVYIKFIQMMSVKDQDSFRMDNQKKQIILLNIWWRVLFLSLRKLILLPLCAVLQLGLLQCSIFQMEFTLLVKSLVKLLESWSQVFTAVSATCAIQTVLPVWLQRIQSDMLVLS
jgi:hypothetical protein